MCSTVYLCAAQQATVVQYVEYNQSSHSETLNNLPTEQFSLSASLGTDPPSGSGQRWDF